MSFKAHSGMRWHWTSPRVPHRWSDGGSTAFLKTRYSIYCDSVKGATTSREFRY